MQFSKWTHNTTILRIIYSLSNKGKTKTRLKNANVKYKPENHYCHVWIFRKIKNDILCHLLGFPIWINWDLIYRTTMLTLNFTFASNKPIEDAMRKQNFINECYISHLRCYFCNGHLFGFSVCCTSTRIYQCLHIMFSHRFQYQQGIWSYIVIIPDKHKN